MSTRLHFARTSPHELAAIGIGYLVGLCVRYVGRGMDSVFGILGAALALLAVLGGNAILWTMYTLALAEEQGTPFSIAEVVNQAMQLTDGIDFVFYGFAVWFGYKNSFRKMNPEVFNQRLEAI